MHLTKEAQQEVNTVIQGERPWLNPIFLEGGARGRKEFGHSYGTTSGRPVCSTARSEMLGFCTVSPTKGPDHDQRRLLTCHYFHESDRTIGPARCIGADCTGRVEKPVQCRSIQGSAGRCQMNTLNVYLYINDSGLEIPDRQSQYISFPFPVLVELWTGTYMKKKRIHFAREINKSFK